MKVLVTGGAGYVGSHVVRKLIKRGAPCLVVDNFRTGHKDLVPGHLWRDVDIADAQALNAAFKEFRPDAVIHLAAMATLSECSQLPELCTRINIDGTRNVLEAMRAYRVSTIVFASSCAVYGPADGLTRLQEDMPMRPASHYGHSKAEGEKLMNAYAAEHGIRHMMMRIFNVAGADPEGGIGERHDPETHLVPIAIEAALGIRPQISIFGDAWPTPDGTAVRDYIHVADVAEGFLRSLSYLNEGGRPQPLNLGSGIPVSVLELIAAVNRHTGRTMPTAVKPNREGDVAYLLCDSTRLHKVLGWKPALSDIDTIVKTALLWHTGQESPLAQAR